MRTTALLLYCLASTSHGRKVSAAAERDPSDTRTELRSLAQLFLAHGKPTAAWQATGYSPAAGRSLASLHTQSSVDVPCRAGVPVQLADPLVLQPIQAPTSFLLADLATKSLPTAQLSDLPFLLGFIAIAYFALLNIYAELQPGDPYSFVPPKPPSSPQQALKMATKMFEEETPAEKAERLRYELVIAAEANKIEEAVEKEKELNEHLLLTGLTFIENSKVDMPELEIDGLEGEQVRNKRPGL